MYKQRLSTLVIFTLVFSVGKILCKDEYLAEAQQVCENKKDFFTCAKVRVLKSISHYAIPIHDANNTESFVKLVKIAPEDDDEQQNVSSTARFFIDDSETNKFVKFLQRQANSFLSHQGLSIAIPDGARVVDETGNDLFESRKKKISKKANMIIPILILFKLFKVKVLVALALAGIFFIKKVILVGALILPTLLHGLKTACKHHLIPHHHDDHHESSFLTGFGGGDYSGGSYYGADQGNKGAWERYYYNNHNNNNQYKQQ